MSNIGQVCIVNYFIVKQDYVAMAIIDDVTNDNKWLCKSVESGLSLK